MSNETKPMHAASDVALNAKIFPKRETQELDKLLAAFAKAQKSIKVAKKDSNNPFFKSAYADLVSVVKASRDALCENGLSIIQRIDKEDSRLMMFTRLGHASGQWMESVIPINPPNANIQTLGSYLTYLRRYAYAALVGVVASDEDDDGEKVAEHERKSKKTVAVEEIGELEKIRG